MPAPTESFDLATASPLTAAGLRGGMVVPVMDPDAPGGPVCDATTLAYLVRFAISAATGLLKGDGYTVAPAVPGTDYLIPAGDGSQLTGLTRGQVAGLSYLHTQSAAAATWTVNHNLGVRPAVSVRSPGGVEVEAEVAHTSANQCVVTFAAPYTGSVFCAA